MRISNLASERHNKAFESDVRMRASPARSAAQRSRYAFWTVRTPRGGYPPR